MGEMRRVVNTVRNAACVENRYSYFEMRTVLLSRSAFFIAEWAIQRFPGFGQERLPHFPNLYDDGRLCQILSSRNVVLTGFSMKILRSFLYFFVEYVTIFNTQFFYLCRNGRRGEQRYYGIQSGY